MSFWRSRLSEAKSNGLRYTSFGAMSDVYPWMIPEAMPEWLESCSWIMCLFLRRKSTP